MAQPPDPIAGQEQTWDRLARSDPMYAVLTSPGREGNRWEPDAFFATGERQIDDLLGLLGRAGAAPDTAGEALDFGCGLGRLTQPLARRFAAATGVDIAAGMVEQARAAAAGLPNASFVHNAAEGLPFEDGRFALVYSSITLQHVPTELIAGYVAELARVTHPRGVLAFHLPDPSPALGLDRAALRRAVRAVRVRLALRTRWRRLRGLPGPPPSPILMGGLGEADVRTVLQAAGMRVLAVRMTNAHDQNSFDGRIVELAAAPGPLVDKLYVARPA